MNTQNINSKGKRYYFRLQYQKGKTTISEKIEGYGYLSISEMIRTILKFRSERIDVEFCGIRGRDTQDNEKITQLIKTYKEMVRNGII